MKKRTWMFLLVAACTSSIFYACSKGDNGGNDTGGNAPDAFKTAMLTNYADTLIIPAYTDLLAKLQALETAANTFLTSPSTNSQATLKVSFKDAYISYEKVAFAYFGPGGTAALNNSLNVFPANTKRIEAGIASGTYSFTVPVASDSIQGFPALDYLFFSTDAVTKFADAGAANRKKYVQDIVSRMKSLVTDVLSQWKTNYRAGFIANTKLDVGSSMGYIINQLAFEMDQMKGPRIGWPFGKMSGGTAYPTNCEGYYGSFSVSLAVANLTSLKNYYTGGTGRGIDDYLLLLGKSSLNSTVLARFDAAIAALQAIPEPMSASFTNSNSPYIDDAYTKIQLLLTAIKTDVASATSIRITYQDSDGD
ncbi:MAG: imelysin family protein [Filimonas sp.]|nr:imelysin family protein [Filimonas sp.]